MDSNLTNADKYCIETARVICLILYALWLYSIPTWLQVNPSHIPLGIRQTIAELGRMFQPFVAKLVAIIPLTVLYIHLTRGNLTANLKSDGKEGKPKRSQFRNYMSLIFNNIFETGTEYKPQQRLALEISRGICFVVFFYLIFGYAVSHYGHPNDIPFGYQSFAAEFGRVAMPFCIKLLGLFVWSFVYGS